MSHVCEDSVYHNVMNLGLNPYQDTRSIDSLTEQTELAYMHKFAEYVTKGELIEWKPYNHLKYLSKRLSLRLLADDDPVRAIISMPPRHGKSFLISEFMPAWYLYWHPTHRIILASYEANFAASWGRKVRDVIQNNREVFQLKVRNDVSAINNWELTTGGGMVTAGVGGPITGKGGNLLLLDDPIKNWEEAESETYREKAYDWFKSTFYSRAEPNASVIIIMTRWHEADVVGKILEDNPNKWDYIKFPAICEDERDILGRVKGDPLCPERYNSDALLDIRETVGPRIFGGLYQQDPAPKSGALINIDDFIYYKDEDLPTSFETIIQSWDMSVKDSEQNDYVACGVWGVKENKFYLLDILRERLDFPSSVREVKNMSTKWKKTDSILIEDKANGPAAIQVLSEYYDNIVPISPMGGKIARAAAASVYVEMHLVYIPDPEVYHKNVDYKLINPFIEEVGKFPNAANDDQTDQMTQAIIYLKGDEEFISKWVAAYGGRDTE
jgi:predicted phage terminase large subunit-like protein